MINLLKLILDHFSGLVLKSFLSGHHNDQTETCLEQLNSLTHKLLIQKFQKILTCDLAASLQHSITPKE